MNKIFKVVWSKARNSYVVVSEVAKVNGKSSVKSIAAALAVAVMMSGGVMSAEAADPAQTTSNERITAGSGTFSDTIYSGIKTTSTNLGGVMNVSGKAVFDNCDFIGNSLIHSGNSNGGVLYVSGSGNLTITNSTIKNNYLESTANRAYGAFLSNAGKVTIDNATIETNLAKGKKSPYGVVINCTGAGSETNISNTTFTNSWSFKDADGNTRTANGKDVIYMNGGTLNLESVSFSGMGISNYINGQANSGASMNKINLSGNNSFGRAMGRVIWNRGILTFEEDSVTNFSGGIEIENSNDNGAKVIIEKDATVNMKSGMAGAGSVIINGGTLNGKIAGTHDVAFDGGTWNVNGNSTATAITGSDYNIVGTGTQTLKVTNSKDTGNTESNGIYSTGSASIKDLKSLEVTSANRHALEAATDMEISNVGTVKLTATNKGNGILAYGDLDINNVDTLVIDAKNGHGIRAAADDGHDANVDIDVKDLTITADKDGETALKASSGAAIDVIATGKATIVGDIEANDTSNIGLSITGAESSITGAVATAAGAMTTLTLDNGAVWNVTEKSNVSQVKGDATINISEAAEGFVTIDDSTGANITLTIEDGDKLGVDVKAGVQEVLDSVVDSSGNSIVDKTSIDKVDLEAAVDATVDSNGKLNVTTTLKPGDTLKVESEIVAAGDVKAGDVSLQETAKNVADNANAIAGNKAAIADNKTAIEKNAKDIATVNTNLVTAVDTINQNVAHSINAINQNVVDGFNTINGAIAAETADRQAADDALQGQIDTNKADIAANEAAIKAETAERKAADAVLQQNIDANTQAVAANAAGIQQNANAIAGLNQNVARLDGRLDKVGAGAAALAALHPLDYDAENKLSFSAGVGNYAGQTAAAVGAFYRPNEDVMFSIGGTAGNGENMVNAGVSFAIGKGSSGVAKMSKAELVQEVTNMKAENEELKQENKDIRHELNKLKELVMKLAEK